MSTIKQSVWDFNPDLVPGYKDYRLLENRYEGLYKTTYHRYMTGDLDHGHSGRVICDYDKLSNEQKAWFALMFGYSYRTMFAYVMLNKFPDLTNTSYMKVNSFWQDIWETDSNGEVKYNWNKMPLNNDTKWHRGKQGDIQKIAWAVKGIQDTIKKMGISPSLYETLKYLSTSGNTVEENRTALESFIDEIPFIRGTMCSWLSQQMLYDLFNWDIDRWKLYPGNWSSRQCLAYIVGDEELANTKHFNKEQLDTTDKYFTELMEKLNDESPFYMDAFSIESTLCEYKKLVVGSGTSKGKVPKKYIAWCCAEINYLLEESQANWPEFNWISPVVGQMTLDESFAGYGYVKDFFYVTFNTGIIMEINKSFPEDVDAYKYLDIPKIQDIKVEPLWDKWNKTFTKTEQDELKAKYHPSVYLKFK